jgi:hypothetical protein
MDFHFTSEEEAFRHELRSWLAANLPREAEANTSAGSGCYALFDGL